MTQVAAVREWLKQASAGTLEARELFPRLARQLPRVISVAVPPDQPSDAVTQPQFILRDSIGKKHTIIFVDPDSARAVPGLHTDDMQEVDTRQCLQAALRLGHDGVVINPGSEQLALNRTHLLLLYREYALMALSAAGGGWVPTRDDSLLIIELRPGIYTVPVYLTEAEGQETAREHGGQVVLHPWSRIRSRAQEACTDGVLLQYGLPDQVPLLRRHLTELAGAPSPDPFDTLEAAVADSIGIANAQEVWRALAGLDQVWTLADSDGDFVALGRCVDLFTSGVLAEQFIRQAREKNPQLPPIVPRLWPAQPLFAAMAAKQPPIGINRGSQSSWIGAEDTIPQVLRMAAQVSAPASAAVGGEQTEKKRASWLARLMGRS